MRRHVLIYLMSVPTRLISRRVCPHAPWIKAPTRSIRPLSASLDTRTKSLWSDAPRRSLFHNGLRVPSLKNYRRGASCHNFHLARLRERSRLRRGRGSVKTDVASVVTFGSPSPGPERPTSPEGRGEGTVVPHFHLARLRLPDQLSYDGL